VAAPVATAADASHRVLDHPLDVRKPGRRADQDQLVEGLGRQRRRAEDLPGEEHAALDQGRGANLQLGAREA